MPIAFQCTNCQSVYTVDDQMVARRVRCKCGAELIIPTHATPPIARPAAQPSNSPQQAAPNTIGDLLSEAYPASTGMESPGVDPLVGGTALDSKIPDKRQFFIRAANAVVDAMPDKVKRAIDGLKEDSSYHTGEWEIEGDVARTVLVTESQRGTTRTGATCVREDGRWYVLD